MTALCKPTNPDPNADCEVCGRKFGDHLFSVRNGYAKCGTKPLPERDNVVRMRGPVGNA